MAAKPVALSTRHLLDALVNSCEKSEARQSLTAESSTLQRDISDDKHAPRERAISEHLRSERVQKVEDAPEASQSPDKDVAEEGEIPRSGSRSTESSGGAIEASPSSDEEAPKLTQRSTRGVGTLPSSRFAVEAPPSSSSTGTLPILMNEEEKAETLRMEDELRRRMEYNREKSGFRGRGGHRKHYEEQMPRERGFTERESQQRPDSSTAPQEQHLRSERTSEQQFRSGQVRHYHPQEHSRSERTSGERQFKAPQFYQEQSVPISKKIGLPLSAAEQQEEITKLGRILQQMLLMPGFGKRGAITIVEINGSKRLFNIPEPQNKYSVEDFYHWIQKMTRWLKVRSIGYIFVEEPLTTLLFIDSAE
ncbi:MAG: hypothetical protein M0R33_15455 [Methylomonas sp.]|jgi:hypothetical protein|uniref:hypothetical protein n=1 Tax=Methylomonas sp. TaxID=418 RepID=UPI0025D673F0|nr:hypothetical protein [Methylomonas sp.]MCK9607839.1 hypothetical protein [Methylomonas sp.]